MMRAAVIAGAALGASVLLAGCGESHSYTCDGPACDRDAGTDGGGDPSLFTCSGPEECVVIPRSCCGSCGAATREDAIAVRADRAADWSAMACDSGDDPIACPGCFMEQDPTLLAGCEEGRCVVVDLHEHPSAQCTVDAECVLRARECCECGADTSYTGLVAINSIGRSAFEEVVCNTDTGCPECAPVYPEDATPACASGHCEVQWTLGL